ncbi:hypothetical protein PAP_10065 [Palaeococcus pacificus DY20341]|uniref:Uncharacterized protein n=1 Tax=Palaeococcus pacificus DY20341 TaxID=1343739 RepID=A0A075LWG4_9EURY|nr:hypothetical protein [Palaeococcus pacificus]AIF70387.1 hypothetical protein PAP_10065 [Palaeococcus pacificus DY20341]
MGKTKKFLTLLLFLSIVMQSALATPYWLKPGVYASYKACSAEALEGDIKYGNEVIIREENETTHLLSPCIYFKWTVLDIKGDKAVLGILLRSENSSRIVERKVSAEEGRKLLEKYQRMYDYSGEMCVNKFVNDTLITMCKNVYREKGPKGELLIGVDEGYAYIMNTTHTGKDHSWSGVVEVDLKTGELLINGTPVGVNFLFSDNPAELKGKEIMEGVTFEETRELNMTVMTYYRDFVPPISFTKSEKIDTGGGWAIDAVAFDGTSGLAITIYMPVSPLWEALGIEEVYSADTLLQRSKSEKSSDRTVLVGFLLEDTNAELIKPEALEEGSISKKALALLLGAFAAFLVVWRWKR